MHFAVHDVLYSLILTNMFWPLLQPSSG